MNSITLAKHSNFHSAACDFLKNEQQEFFLTSEQLGQALGYLQPRKSISNLVNRHPYLKSKEFSGTINVVTPGGTQQTRVFSEDGIYEVTFLANTERALEFRSWVRKLLKELRKADVKIYPEKAEVVPHIIAEVQFLKDKVSRTHSDIESLTQKVDQQMTIDHARQSKVQFAIKSRVIELLGGKESIHYEELRHKYFAAIYSDVKKRMGVCSYKDIRVKDYDEALFFIKNWYPEFHTMSA